MIGRTLAHYEIVSALGKGGMGEVYLARDTKLGREVAIKTLPDEYARDADRLARFEREARFLATLEHPNIAGIHGLEEADGTRFLVLELVEGGTLADRLHEPIRPPPREALRLALQIAQALEAAHAKGIVHRDLKPANIKITHSGQIKVLDFGLAKALDSGGARDVNRSHSPSNPGATRDGAVLGTADYMSPEQARGEAVDLRADIWAFGCVLYEMLTGTNPFAGRTVSDTLAAVLKSEPEWSRLPADLHPRVRYLLERCLRKEARERPTHVTEVRTEIEKALADPHGAKTAHVSGRVQSRSRLFGAAATVLAGVLALAAGAAWFDSDESLPLMRFGFALPTPLRTLPDIPAVAVSADGARLAYTTLDGLWVRGREEPAPVAVPGPRGWIGTPAFSPNGLALAYVNSSTPDGPFSIMRVPVGGGTPTTIHLGISSVPTDLDWDERDVLMYVQPDGVWEVSAAGGGDARLVLAAEDGETLASPQRLPGDAILFTATKATGSDRWDQATIFVAPPRSTAANRQVVREGGSDARYVPSGHLLFAEGTTLWAAPFSPSAARLTGERFRVVDRVLRAASGTTDTAHYAISANGSLVHLGVGAEDPAGAAGGASIDLGAPEGLTLAWVDRMGNEEAIDVRPDRYSSVRLSPDGNRVALVIGGNPIVGEPRDIWILDLRTEDLSRLTTDGQSDAPIWLDNETILYRATPAPVGVFSKPIDGGEARLLRRSSTAPTAYPLGLTADKRTLVVLQAPTVAQQSLFTLALDGDSDYVPLLEEPGVQSFSSIAPNGRFMVYHYGPNSSQTNVMVRPFPDVARRSYTVAQGAFPVFSRDGSEIFYFDGQSLAAVPVDYEPFDIGTPVRLGLSGPYFYGANRTWDEGPDGRFIITRMGATNAPQGSSLQVQVVVGLSQLLEERTR